MPEGVESYLLACQLNELAPINVVIIREIRPKQTSSVSPNSRKTLTKGVPREFRLLKVVSIGKMVVFIISIDNDNTCQYGIITFALSLTGAFRIGNTSKNRELEELPPASTRVHFMFGDKNIWFVDPRKLGRITYYETDGLPENSSKIISLLADHGIRRGLNLGPWSMQGNNIQLLRILNKPKYQNRKTLLVITDQSIMAGIGNYLRSEIFYVSKIDLNKKLGDLTVQDKRRLTLAIRSIFRKIIRLRGSPKYTLANGEKGKYVFKCYGVQGRNKDGVVIKTKKSGNQSFYYPDWKA